MIWNYVIRKYKDFKAWLSWLIEVDYLFTLVAVDFWKNDIDDYHVQVYVLGIRVFSYKKGQGK